uniref:C2H2-type domain-containing protein n=1 Tax=viral metagenome TaxID=1070528 RepID=A0A6C0C0E9_9ZZZZ
MPKNADIFYCEKCNFKCSKKSNWDKHTLTAKHINTTNTTKKMPKQFNCECGKEYTHRASLFNHKKKCSFVNKPEIIQEHITEENIIDQTVQSNKLIAQDSIVNNLMKQNEHLHKLIINRDEEQRNRDEEQRKRDEEQRKRDEEHKKEIEKLSEQISKMSTVTNNKTTNNNNKFNLNFFLNTQCKDAMSIQSFMENLKLGCKELEHMGDVGYLNGMIDIFNSTIGNMDVYKRPLHCTDLKREVLYFKHGNDWEKDSEDKKHLKKLIKNVESKNYDNLQEWQKDHPGSLQCDSRDSEHYMKIATEALGGADSNKDSIYLTKIMKHIVREVHVKP